MLSTRLIQAALFTAYVTAGEVSGQGYHKFDFSIRNGFNLVDVVKNFVDNLDDLNFDISRRDGAEPVDLSNERSFYIASIKVGSEESEVKVLLDTGSADLWIMSSNNPQCSDNGGSVDCSTYGTYDEKESSTWVNNETEFSITYLDQTYAKGNWGQETIKVTDDLVLEGANIALANDTDSNVGVFGIAYTGMESSSTKYDNFPIQIKQQGLIKKVAYSLYLTGAERNTGSILFGGVDHAKYSGDLVAFDIVPHNNANVYLQIELTDITVHVTNNATSSSSVPTTLLTATTSGASHQPTIAVSQQKREDTTVDVNANALFDSGTTLSYFSKDVLTQLVDAVDPDNSYNTHMLGYQVSCSVRNEDNYLEYNFQGKKTIQVPLSDVVIVNGQNGTTGEPICMFGGVAGSLTILGDNFLRHAYSVFDLEDNTISIAQIKYDDDNEDIEVLE